jgi:hypothetical protein
MRAGPLSNDKVIDTLNRYFVPVFTSNEDYEKNGPASPDERKERDRIFDECAKNGTSVGTVHVYLLAPDGRAIDSAHVASVTSTPKLQAMLDRCIAKLGTRGGEPLVKPKALSVAPAAPDGGLVLHLVSRGQDTGPQGGSWREFPAENWVVLSARDAAGFLPASDPSIGSAFGVDAQSADRLLQYFYPQSEDPTDSPLTKIDRQSLKSTVVKTDHGIATARLEGEVQLERNFYPGKVSPEHMHATVLGFVTWDVQARRIRSFQLVTDEATRDKEYYAVAVSTAGGA